MKKVKNDAKNLPDACIPYNTVFTGQVDTPAGVRVDGTIKGNVTAGGDVTVGADGKVEGNVQALNVNIAGEIAGNVTASGTVQMLSGAKLMGDLAARSFAIEQGGVFKGKCIIADTSEAATDKKQPATRKESPAPTTQKQPSASK